MMKKWSKWVVGLLAICLLAGLSVGLYFFFRACGMTDLESLREIVASCGAWGWLVFIVLFVMVTTFLCFIPGTSATFIALSIVLFGAWVGFAVSVIGVLLSSMCMFLVGRLLGEKAVKWLVGEQALHKAQNLMDMKSKMLLPLMFLFPCFPDDALCMVAGLTKMKWWQFGLIVLIFRSVGVASICFLGSGFIDWSALSLVDWFVLVNVCVIDLFFIFKYQDKLEKFILRKRKKNEAEMAEQPSEENEEPVTDYEVITETLIEVVDEENNEKGEKRWK